MQTTCARLKTCTVMHSMVCKGQEKAKNRPAKSGLEFEFCSFPGIRVHSHNLDAKLSVLLLQVFQPMLGTPLGVTQLRSECQLLLTLQTKLHRGHVLMQSLST